MRNPRKGHVLSTAVNDEMLMDVVGLAAGKKISQSEVIREALKCYSKKNKKALKKARKIRLDLYKRSQNTH